MTEKEFAVNEPSYIESEAVDEAEQDDALDLIN